MKAFLQGVAVMLAITVIAAVSFNFVPNASKDVYQDRPNVRL
jgi:hypothetical protein